MHRSEGLFERELIAMMRDSPYSADDLSRLVRTPMSDLCDEAQWLRIVAIQAGLEFMDRVGYCSNA